MNRKTIVPLLVALLVQATYIFTQTEKDRKWLVTQNTLSSERNERAKTRFTSKRFTEFVNLEPQLLALIALVESSHNLTAAQKRHATRARHFSLGRTPLTEFENRITLLKALLKQS